MARPTKSAKVIHPRTQTKAEMKKRIEIEEKLKGDLTKIEPSARLNSNQKKIFTYIVTEMAASKILGNLDMYILEMTCIAIDRLQNIEKIINQDFERICDKDLMASKAKYTTDFFKGVQDLCLSPASRAKMGVIAANKMQEEADPLLKVLQNKSS